MARTCKNLKCRVALKAGYSYSKDHCSIPCVEAHTIYKLLLLIASGECPCTCESCIEIQSFYETLRQLQSK